VRLRAGEGDASGGARPSRPRCGPPVPHGSDVARRVPSGPVTSYVSQIAAAELQPFTRKAGAQRADR
jgi:hypothetical protein